MDKPQQAQTKPPQPGPSNPSPAPAEGQQQKPSARARREQQRRAGGGAAKPPPPKAPSFLEKFLSPGPNPRGFDNLFFDSQEILDGRDNFEGLFMVLTRFVNNKFDLAHTIQFGSSLDPPGYAFAAAYRDKGTSLLGKWFPATGTIQGRIQQIFWRILTARLIVKSSRQPGQSQITAEVDMKWKDLAAQVKFHHMQAVEVSYTQSVTKSLQAGILAFYDMMTGQSGWKSGLKYAARAGTWAFSYASLGNFTLSYTQALPGKRKVWTTDMEFTKLAGQDVWEAIWAAGYMYNLLGSMVKGRVDSRLRASVFVEEKVNEAISILLCADVDYLKDSYKIGFGLTMNT